MRGANVQAADLSDANLEGANFWRATAKKAQFEGAFLRDTLHLPGNFTEANFIGAKLEGTGALRRAEPLASFYPRRRAVAREL